MQRCCNLIHQRWCKVINYHFKLMVWQKSPENGSPKIKLRRKLALSVYVGIISISSCCAQGCDCAEMLISTSVWYLREETVTDGWQRDLSKQTSNCDDLCLLPTYLGQCVLHRGPYKPSQIHALCRLAMRRGPHGFKWEQKIKSTETWTVINIDNSLLHLNAGEKAAFSNEVKRWSPTQ